MKKEIICVYQDCPLCGDKGKKLKKLIFDKKLNVRKVSFASPEGGELCRQAVFEHKIRQMPFFTDGERFEQTLEDFLKQPKKVVKETFIAKATPEEVRALDDAVKVLEKKTLKKAAKKEAEDGSDS